jgi:hypothetical protein
MDGIRTEVGKRDEEDAENPSPTLEGNQRQRWQALKKTYRKRDPQWARHAPQYSSQTQKGAAKEGSKVSITVK